MKNKKNNEKERIGGEILTNPFEFISGTIGNIVFQKNNKLRIRKIQGQRKRRQK